MVPTVAPPLLLLLPFAAAPPAPTPTPPPPPPPAAPPLWEEQLHSAPSGSLVSLFSGKVALRSVSDKRRDSIDQEKRGEREKREPRC